MRAMAKAGAWGALRGRRYSKFDHPSLAGQLWPLRATMRRMSGPAQLMPRKATAPAHVALLAAGVAACSAMVPVALEAAGRAARGKLTSSQGVLPYSEVV